MKLNKINDESQLNMFQLCHNPVSELDSEQQGKWIYLELPHCRWYPWARNKFLHAFKVVKPF